MNERGNYRAGAGRRICLKRQLLKREGEKRYEGAEKEMMMIASIQLDGFYLN